ncbi:srg family chemoreceptor domain-containing protein [Ditylenchus destructor]|uniref:Serpentine receptor class gamma n=1 Tax=Ditylenchus destructor TaxID=166010 RepID=A0AAD4NJ89_9BILA|nr:srg family chemoreceptor domain-containing protein [Ditylenchus destructor]
MRYHTKEERNKIMTVENVPTGQAEINVFIVAVCMVIFQTGNGCFQWLFFIFRKNNMSHALNILFAQLPWISDLNSLSTPWVLIIVNSAIRHQVFSFNSPKSYCKHNKIFSVHSSNNIP